MDDAIGVFDSGLGGLTAVKELKNCLPGEDIIYFGDTGRVPYGTRSKETIIKYVRQDIEFLKSFPIKAILVACGTASSLALPEVKDEYNIPIIGVVEPACLKAAQVSKNKRVAVIGTPGTISSGSYERVLSALDLKIQTKSLACPLFVPLVENGRFKRGDRVAQMVAEEYLLPLKEFSPDVLILGCTHYPLLKDVISDIMGENVTLVDPGFEAAHYIKTVIKASEKTREKKGNLQFYVSDNIYNFSSLADIFLQCSIYDKVKKVDIEKYSSSLPD